MHYFLGVEGGGSKTNILLTDQNENKLAENTTGPSNYHVVGIEGVVNTIIQGIHVCLDHAVIQPQDVAAICMGLAGLNTQTDRDILDTALTPKLQQINLPQPTLVNDAVISLVSAAEKPNAVLLISGTGSNCYGVNEQGEEVWVGGLEQLLSDDGSGYMIGAKALRVATQSMDGRIPHSILEDLVLQKLQVPNMREASRIVQSPAFTKTKVAELAPVVFEAEQKGDIAAKKIIQESINEAYIMVSTAVKRLGLETKEFDFVLTGSISHTEVFNKPLINMLKSEYHKINITSREKPPLMGAIKLAKESIR
jgi:N-acetylglucosamine kinase-like BadF-type ATPase